MERNVGQFAGHPTVTANRDRTRPRGTPHWPRRACDGDPALWSAEELRNPRQYHDTTRPAPRRATRSGEVFSACPSCGHVPTAEPEAHRQNADLAVDWIHLRDGHIVAEHHCWECFPRDEVADIECAFCGDGPLAVGALADDIRAGAMPESVRTWLQFLGWQQFDTPHGPICAHCARRAQCVRDQ